MQKDFFRAGTVPRLIANLDPEGGGASLRGGRGVIAGGERRVCLESPSVLVLGNQHGSQGAAPPIEQSIAGARDHF
jgi:hypothetical protein